MLCRRPQELLGLGSRKLPGETETAKGPRHSTEHVQLHSWEPGRLNVTLRLTVPMAWAQGEPM